MRVDLVLVLTLLAALPLGSGCEPAKKCGGTLYYDPREMSCRRCPSNAMFQDGTCVCAKQMEFVDHRCKLMEGATPEVPDASSAGDASNPSGSSCSDYCDFTQQCFGDNNLAVTAIPDVVTALAGTDRAACVEGCETASGGDGSDEPVVACIEAGRAAAACAGDDTINGLRGALELYGNCCGSKPDNALCNSICTVLTGNPLTASQSAFCD